MSQPRIRITNPLSKGDKGDPGEQGIQGIQGEQGIQGIQGIQGLQGAALTILGNYPTWTAWNNANITGEAGDAWIILEDGSLMVWDTLTSSWFDAGDLQGPQGIQGIQGPKGDQGIQGVQGEQGLRGDTGATGAKGDTGATGPAGGFGYYGSFYDTITQNITKQQESTGIPVLIRSTDTDATKGFSVIDNSKIKAQYAGVYNFAFSFQWHNTGGGGNGTTVEIWFTKNGQLIPDSNTRVAVNTNSPYVVSAWNIFQKMNVNDYVQMYWATDNYHIEMAHNTGLMGGPAIPSAIITVNQVG